MRGNGLLRLDVEAIAFAGVLDLERCSAVAGRAGVAQDLVSGAKLPHYPTLVLRTVLYLRYLNAVAVLKEQV